MREIDKQKRIRKIINLMKKKKRQPVTTDFVAHKLGIGWGTSRGILLNMALDGKVKAVKTTQSFVFVLADANESKSPHKERQKIDTSDSFQEGLTTSSNQTLGENNASE